MLRFRPTGASGGWVAAAFDLADYVGEYVFFRISYHTDTYVSEEGIYVDDISPVAAFGSHTPIFPVTDTFYTFTDKPAGTYYYKVRARDADRQWSGYSNIARTTASGTYLCGDANADLTVNVADAVYLVNYIFKGGPAPDPAEAGDANGDGDINVGDTVYLINFVFKGGPEPICP
jgi:hypothetical protein